MAQRQNTNNPLPSNDLKDLNDNTIILDEVINSQESNTTDRFGNPMKTLSEIYRLVNEAIGEGRVISVNGKNGIVTLTAGDIGAVSISKGEVKQDINFSGNITVKNKNLLSPGDYGLGGLTLKPITSFNQSPENGYYYAIGADSEEPTEGAPEGSSGLLFVNVKTNNGVTVYDVVEAGEESALYNGRYVDDKLTWSETITTENINKFVKSAAGSLINIEVFNSSGTYVPSANVKTIKVHVVGGGGGGGGFSTVKSYMSGNGGGGGGYSMSIFNIEDIDITGTACTVGAGGTGGSYGSGSGVSGGASKFGTILTANGGGGGAWNNDLSPGAGGTATGGSLNVTGEAGLRAGLGDGGFSFYTPTFGRGGAGAVFAISRADANSGRNSNGSPGLSGIIIIEEFS
ncbi:hypothetical protein RHO15_09560 [Utexia brackfieldae]|uniref:glycine-rich domain-containing protein n=1 Tax=Utexia brackfieldae TaxID=3074108 RepID=UPI00370D72D9